MRQLLDHLVHFLTGKLHAIAERLTRAARISVGGALQQRTRARHARVTGRISGKEQVRNLSGGSVIQRVFVTRASAKGDRGGTVGRGSIDSDNLQARAEETEKTSETRNERKEKKVRKKTSRSLPTHLVLVCLRPVSTETGALAAATGARGVLRSAT